MDVNSWLILGVGLILLLARARSPSVGEVYRMFLVEKKLDAVVKALGIEFTETLDNDLRNLALSGRKIAAIRLYRERTGCGLKAAKEHVERLML